MRPRELGDTFHRRISSFGSRGYQTATLPPLRISRGEHEQKQHEREKIESYDDDATRAFALKLETITLPPTPIFSPQVVSRDGPAVAFRLVRISGFSTPPRRRRLFHSYIRRCFSKHSKKKKPRGERRARPSVNLEEKQNKRTVRNTGAEKKGA